MDIQKLYDILTELHPEVDFTTAEGLVDSKVLDSFDIVTILSEVTTAFGVKIPAGEIVPKNFNSAAALFALIEKLDDED